MCDYAAKLTLDPTKMEAKDVQTLREAGLEDNAILT
jgi:uncharacterized protein YciW